MKKIALALATVALLATGISGAYAATAYSSIADCSALTGDSSDWSTTPLADKLSAQGIAYDSIGVVNGCFSVVKTNADGSKVMDLYDPTTLSEIRI